jgi:hypothetical protein
MPFSYPQQRGLITPSNEAWRKSMRGRAGEVCRPDSRRLLERISSGVAQAGGYRIRIRGKRADVWSPHAVLGRGVSRRDIVAGRHGLGCEYGCRDQRGRHERDFGHLFLHMVAEAKEAFGSLL